MGYIVRMPSLGMQMDQGEIVAWYVEEGDAASEGDALAEIESEKATAEIEADEEGVIRRVFFQAGDMAEPGTPLGIVADADEDISDLEREAAESGVDVETTAASDSPDEPASEGAEASNVMDSDAAGAPDASERDAEDGDSPVRRVTPRAQQRAEELGVDVASIDGSGPDGAITSADLEAATDTDTGTSHDADRTLITPRAQKRAEELDLTPEIVDGSAPNGGIIERDVEAAAESSISGVLEEREPSGMRRTIAERLGESYRNAIHVTETREIDVETLFAATDAADEALDVDVSVTDVLLRTVSQTLAEHPEFNARFEEGVHRLYEPHNVAVAIDVEDGLVTPVLRDVGSKSLVDLATERDAVTDRTLAGEYTMDDFAEGTFTVSNLGVLGVDAFTPIINPPQVAILGVGRARQRAVPASGGNVEFRRQMVFSLSFDHRVVDGADAARFLDTLAENVENAWSAVIDG